MKKGSVLNPSGESTSNTVKRKRTNNEAPPSIREGRGILDLDSTGRRTRQPALGRANKDWELPNIASTELNIASSWEAAMADSVKEPKVDYSAKVGATEYDDNMSSIYTQSVATGFGSNALSSSNATYTSKSTATTATASTASGTTMSYSFAQPMTVDPATKSGPHPQASAPAPANSVPKAILYTFFGKKPWRKQIGNDDYFYWNNGAKPHELKFTAIFQNPLSGECFPSGRYGNPDCYVASTLQNREGRDVEVIWYTKKTLAEHGAAARCYDCLTYRQNLQEAQLGTDPPYLPRNAPPMPPLPPDIEQQINQNSKRIQEINKGGSV